MDTSVAVIAVKVALYFASLTASGGALFVALFGAQLTLIERTRILRFARAMAVVALFATLARVLSVVAMLGDEWAAALDTSLIRMVLDGTEGRAALMRSVGLVILALGLFGGSRAFPVALLGALGAVLSFGTTGHTGSMGVLATGIVGVHLLAAAYWIGALIPLYGLAGTADQQRLARILTRFGDRAAGFVGALVAAGLALLWMLLGSLEAVVNSEYGRLVLLKLALVGLLLLLAAVNKWRLTPAIASGNQSARGKLRRSIAAEIALVIAILAATATFTTITGPPEIG